MTEKQKKTTYQQKRKRMITITAVVVLVVFLGYTILGSLLTAVYAGERSAQDEMRGIWVSTVYSLDYPESATVDDEELRRQADEILDSSKAMGMNAVFCRCVHQPTLFMNRITIPGAGIFPVHRDWHRKTASIL